MFKRNSRKKLEDDLFDEFFSDHGVIEQSLDYHRRRDIMQHKLDNPYYQLNSQERQELNELNRELLFLKDKHKRTNQALHGLPVSPPAHPLLSQPTTMPVVETQEQTARHLRQSLLQTPKTQRR